MCVAMDPIKLKLETPGIPAGEYAIQEHIGHQLFFFKIQMKKTKRDTQPCIMLQDTKSGIPNHSADLCQEGYDGTFQNIHQVLETTLAYHRSTLLFCL